MGIEKGFNTQFALSSLIGKWKETLDNKGHKTHDATGFV